MPGRKKLQEEHLFDLELVEGVDTSVDCLTMSYLNYTDFIAFDNEKLTCSFGIFANSVETNKTFNLNNNTAIYIHTKSQKVEKYAKIILTSTYQDLVEWEVYDSVVDINMCNGICQIKGYKDCMMFEFIGNTCRISKQVQKPMNKLNDDGTGLTKRTIFVDEGNAVFYYQNCSDLQ